MLIQALFSGILLSFGVFGFLKWRVFSSKGEKKAAEIIGQNKAGEALIHLLFNNFSIEKIAADKINLVIGAIKKELAIPPIFFLPSIEQKIINKGVLEVIKIAEELKEKAIFEANDPLIHQLMAHKVFSYLDNRKNRYLWGLTAAAFISGFFLSLAAYGLTLII